MSLVVGLRHCPPLVICSLRTRERDNQLNYECAVCSTEISVVVGTTLINLVKEDGNDGILLLRTEIRKLPFIKK